MPRQIPRLRWAGGDSRSSVWFGLAKLCMHDKYVRIEAIRRSRRGRARAAILTEAAAGATTVTTPGDDQQGTETEPPMEEGIDDEDTQAQEAQAGDVENGTAADLAHVAGAGEASGPEDRNLRSIPVEHVARDPMPGLINLERTAKHKSVLLRFSPQKQHQRGREAAYELLLPIRLMKTTKNHSGLLLAVCQRSPPYDLGAQEPSLDTRILPLTVRGPVDSHLLDPQLCGQPELGAPQRLVWITVLPLFRKRIGSAARRTHPGILHATLQLLNIATVYLILMNETGQHLNPLFDPIFKQCGKPIRTPFQED
ncbi:uncharacterized protein A1O5_10484 [Cladophialophora psammophila CBS 110553]|uniref:Uncharacterized protein n=1 Tax=Cladophialophora psammophila CBS 110553 TaxID=1182543 RepID=W9WE31_9EURO|nr:uncharacterized protein A1O5_10484 [Cladophialophora psammophila CBS 110553]EXJ66332.1 hypothetical protein A1O5_10484 [Cladophialophora psammophila CBS 110553]